MDKDWNITVTSVVDEESDNVSVNFDFEDLLVDDWIDAQDDKKFDPGKFEKWFMRILRKLLITLERKHGKYEKVFIRGHLGSVEDLEIGDWVNFYDKRGASVTREVTLLVKDRIHLASLVYKGSVLAGPMETIKTAVTEILRPV